MGDVMKRNHPIAPASRGRAAQVLGKSLGGRLVVLSPGPLGAPQVTTCSPRASFMDVQRLART